jgi:hypothetical protein
MWWAIEYVLRIYLRGREIVVLGDGYNALKWRMEFQHKASHSLTLQTQRVDKHYIVICEDEYQSHDDELKAMGFVGIEDYYDWTKFNRTNGHLPIDVEYNGIKFGRVA